MSDQNIMAALQIRLQDFAKSQPMPLRIAYEGRKFTPEADRTHLADHLLPANPFNPDIAVRRTRFVGIYQVDVNAPSSANVVEVRRLADALRGYFPRLLRLTDGGVTVHINGVSSRGPLMSGADRISIPVSIPYRADVVRNP